MAPHLHHARIGAAAIPPARMHPIDIAAQTALLSQMAQGGVYIGLARGAWLADHGITESHKPIQAIREAVGVIRYLLEGKTGGYRRRNLSSRAPCPRALSAADRTDSADDWLVGQNLVRAGRRNRRRGQSRRLRQSRFDSRDS